MRTTHLFFWLVVITHFFLGPVRRADWIYDLQLKVLQDSTITEDTLIEEVVHASQSHRDRIKEMRALPPLIMNEDRF